MDYGHSRYEQRLLVQLVEDFAQESPNRAFSSIPNTSDLKDGFTDVTFSQVVRATDCMCQFLRAHVGVKPVHEFETLTYIGIPDLRYTFLLYAAIKCGYKMFFPSPRNPASTNLSLMQQTSSTKVLHSSELAPVAKGLVSAGPGAIAIQIPTLGEILSGQAEHTPYAVTFEAGLDHPILVLHSSGSTGLPKPITIRNGTVAAGGADRSYRTPEGRMKADFTIQDFGGKGGLVYNPFPPFHMGGFYMKSVIPVLTLAVPVYSPALRLPSAELVLEVLQNLDVKGAVLPPSIVEGMLHLPSGLEYLKRLDFLSYAGGPLSLAAGEEISKYTKLFAYYGSTETASARLLMPLPGEWAYLEFHPDEPLRLDPAEDDTYELVYLADPRRSSTYAGGAAFAHSLPGLTEYRSKDLFRRHPTKPHLWQFHGRRDDIFVLSTGEKFNPVPMELAVGSDSAASAALVVGTGRFRPAILVEPQADYRTRPDLRDMIWLAVQRANLDAPGPGRVSEDMIVIGDPERPFVRAGKGTVVRKLTTALYEQDIAALYEKDRLGAPSSAAPSIKFDASNVTLESIKGLVRSIFIGLLPGTAFEDDSNVYLLGMDSLKTAEAMASLAGYLGRKDWLTPNLCYTNPNVQELASAVYARLGGAHVHQPDDQVSKMQAMIAKFVRSSETKGSTSAKPVVAITGTTGSLGGELFRALVESGAASKIICLNRSPSAQAKWEEASSAQSTARTGGVVKFYTVDLARSKLGLGEDHAAEVQASDVLIHNAWKVDFNQSLASFELDLIGLRNLIDLCSLSKKPTPPHLVYISSISAAGRLDIVPEGPISDLRSCMSMGYGQSKLVAEHIADEAGAREVGLPVTVLRVGQIAASRERGRTAWSEKEAIPGMFRTSKALGLIPGDIQPVNWIPIDELARVILELALLRKGPGSHRAAAFYNLVNPHNTKWQDLVGSISQYCGGGKVVSLRDWVAALKQLDRTDQAQLQSKPALKTLEFFEDWSQSTGVGARFETTAAAKDSPTFAQLKPIDGHTLTMWLELMQA